MIVVADTTPINHLALVGKATILREIYGRIVIPDEVYRELRSEKTPTVVRDFVESSGD